MSKLTIDLPDDVIQAITEEGQREYRNVSQQASYLLLMWSREAAEKRQRSEKAAGKAWSAGGIAPSLGCETVSPHQ